MSEQQFPAPTVGAFIINPQGEVLMVQSHKWHDRFTIPGGHIELGERMEDALVREVKEETGLDVTDLEFLLFQEFIFDEAYWKRGHFIFFDFACRTECTDVSLNHEAEHYEWVSPEDALSMDIDRYTERALQRYLELREK